MQVLLLGIVCIIVGCSGNDVLYGPDNMIYHGILNRWNVKESCIGCIFSGGSGYYIFGDDTESFRLNGPDNEMYLIQPVSTVGYKNIQGSYNVFIYCFLYGLN